MRRVTGIVIVVIVAGLAMNHWLPLSQILDTDSENALSDCRIKGNISIDGERIYHVPGGRWYAETRIDGLEGERWFCSEAGARRAGWRRSYE